MGSPNNQQADTAPLTDGGTLYRLVDRVAVLTMLVRKGGILLKWTAIVMTITVLVVALLSTFINIMATAALKKSARQLCQTIAGNISSVESIITAEKKPFKRSVILQDLVSGLSKSNINGFEYAAVYDISGNLVERDQAYAAHTKSVKRATRIPDDLYAEIKLVKGYEEKPITVTRDDGSSVSCYRYRMPFTFFNVPVGIIEVVFTEESILGSVNRMKIYLAILGFVFIMLGIVASIFTTRRMVQPINQLAAGIQRVRGGDLNVELSVKRHDELGELSDEFNNLIVHLREKLQMQKFVSDSTISMIKEQSKSGDIGLGGTRQNLTFLFSDVRGFTAMSERLEPEKVVAILNKYLDLQAQIIKKNKGDIDKFVGDEVMAVFDGPKKTDNAFIAAIEIVEAIKKLNREMAKNDLQTIDVGIGIHGGEVVHGRMGSRDRMDNTSIGDTVNLSARLCSQAEAGTILVSKEVLSSASKGKFMGKKLEPIKVKGKSQPIEIFLITGMKK